MSRFHSRTPNQRPAIYGDLPQFRQNSFRDKQLTACASRDSTAPAPTGALSSNFCPLDDMVFFKLQPELVALVNRLTQGLSSNGPRPPSNRKRCNRAPPMALSKRELLSGLSPWNPTLQKHVLTLNSRATDGVTRA